MIRLEDKVSGDVIAKLENLPSMADVGDVLELDGDLWRIDDIDTYPSGSSWVYATKVHCFEVEAIPDEPWRGAERREE
jgi:hypothetical protein